MTHLEQELKTTAVAGNRLGVEPRHQDEAFQLHGLTGLLKLEACRYRNPSVSELCPRGSLCSQPGTGSFPVLTALPSTFPPLPTQGIKTQILV